jgi:hypothetical protein
MQAMDFSLSVLVSGIIITVLLYISIYIFYRRLYGIKDRLTVETYQSLRSFGIALFFLGLVFPTGVLLTSMMPILIALIFFWMIRSQLLLSISDKLKVSKYGLVMIALIIVLSIETIARVLIVPYSLPPIVMMIGLSILLVLAVGGAIYVLRESPSPFTASMMVIIVFTMIAALTAILGFIVTSPQYFILLVLPIAVAVGVASSMLRPWRNIVTTSLLALIICVGPALFVPALIAGNTTIFLFTTSLTFALLCLTIPLSFFLQQAVETRATTALYISVSLTSIALLALTHGNNFSIASSSIGTWDEIILFVDWLFGILAVSTFTMAAISSVFSVNVRHASREILIGFSIGLLVLGHPIVRWVEVDNVLIQRWELDPLYLGIIAMLLIAFAVFTKMSYQLWKAGSGRAGLRFVFFMLATLFLGIVAMFADMIPLELIVPLFLLSGMMLILSSPRRNPFTQSS